jgi:hypothetical protein
MHYVNTCTVILYIYDDVHKRIKKKKIYFAIKVGNQQTKMTMDDEPTCSKLVDDETQKPSNNERRRLSAVKEGPFKTHQLVLFAITVEGGPRK